MARSIKAETHQTCGMEGPSVRMTWTGLSLCCNTVYFKHQQEISCITTGLILAEAVHLQCCIHMYPPPSSCGLCALVHACIIKHHHSSLFHIIFFCTLPTPFNYHMFSIIFQVCMQLFSKYFSIFHYMHDLRMTAVTLCIFPIISEYNYAATQRQHVHWYESTTSHGTMFHKCFQVTNHSLIFPFHKCGQRSNYWNQKCTIGFLTLCYARRI